MDNGRGSITNPYKKRKIFVGGLREELTEEQFKNYFSCFGGIIDSVIIRDRPSNRSKGFGFVTFESEESFENAKRQKFHDLCGKLAEVKEAIPKELINNNCENGNSVGRFSNGIGCLSSSDQQHLVQHTPNGYGYGPFLSYAPYAINNHFYYPNSYGGWNYMGAYDNISYAMPPIPHWYGSGVNGAMSYPLPNAAMPPIPHWYGSGVNGAMSYPLPNATMPPIPHWYGPGVNGAMSYTSPNATSYHSRANAVVDTSAVCAGFKGLKLNGNGNGKLNEVVGGSNAYVSSCHKEHSNVLEVKSNGKMEEAVGCDANVPMSGSASGKHHQFGLEGFSNGLELNVNVKMEAAGRGEGNSSASGKPDDSVLEVKSNGKMEEVVGCDANVPVLERSGTASGKHDEFGHERFSNGVELNGNVKMEAAGSGGNASIVKGSSSVLANRMTAVVRDTLMINIID